MVRLLHDESRDRGEQEEGQVAVGGADDPPALPVMDPPPGDQEADGVHLAPEAAPGQVEASRRPVGRGRPDDGHLGHRRRPEAYEAMVSAYDAGDEQARALAQWMRRLKAAAQE